ncbi:MAG: hypothetical protein IPJ65_26835 [Archangiaceae bacterium]|nr:hypothetical protein [Archangiaceae bacterium]
MKEGAKALPPNAVTALGHLALLGVVFTVLEGNKAIRKGVPSPPAWASACWCRPCGGVDDVRRRPARLRVEKKDKKSSDAYSAPLASGSHRRRGNRRGHRTVVDSNRVIPND